MNEGPATAAVRAALAPSGEWCEAGNANDAAVRAINQRKGASPYCRVSFAEWCVELGVERGS